MQALPRHIVATAAGPTTTRGVAASASLRSRSRFVCPSCQQQRQQQQQQQQRASFSSSSPAPPSSPSSLPPQPPRSGYARLTSRRLISIGGVDAPRFLQGIITSSVPNVHERGGFYSAFLNATGRVLHDVFVYPDTLRVGVAADDPSLDSGQAFLIEVDADQVGELSRHLRRYMLRSKLKVRALDEEGDGGCGVWHVWDDSRASGADVSALLQQPSHHHQRDTIVLRDDRAPGLGYRILSRTQGSSLSSSQQAMADRLGPRHEQTDDATYRVRRYLMGVPEGQAEIPRASAVPLEANLDLMGGVDFRKGCYVGQELTIRTKHRGVVRKRILPCVVYGATTDEGKAAPSPSPSPSPEKLEYNNNRPDATAAAAVAAEDIPGDLSIGRDGKRGRSAGNWLRGVGNIGLALCRLQVMTDVQLPGETATAPFDPNNEFVMRWGDGEGEDVGKAVKVKAFVPEWLRTRLDESNGSSH